MVSAINRRASVFTHGNTARDQLRGSREAIVSGFV
jgi:hypothetical protein